MEKPHGDTRHRQQSVSSEAQLPPGEVRFGTLRFVYLSDTPPLTVAAPVEVDGDVTVYVSPPNPEAPSFVGRSFRPRQLPPPSATRRYSYPPTSPLWRHLHSTEGRHRGSGTGVCHIPREAMTPPPRSALGIIDTLRSNRGEGTGVYHIHRGEASSSARNVSSLPREDFTAGHSASNFQATPCRHYPSGTCTYGSSCRFLHDVKGSIPSMEASSSSSKLPSTPTTTVTPSQLGSGAGSECSSTSTAVASDYWSPLDDGINCQLPGLESEETLTREEFEALMKNLEDGPFSRKSSRFAEFFPKE